MKSGIVIDFPGIGAATCRLYPNCESSGNIADSHWPNEWIARQVERIREENKIVLSFDRSAKLSINGVNYVNLHFTVTSYHSGGVCVSHGADKDTQGGRVYRYAFTDAARTKLDEQYGKAIKALYNAVLPKLREAYEAEYLEDCERALQAKIEKIETARQALKRYGVRVA